MNTQLSIAADLSSQGEEASSTPILRYAFTLWHRKWLVLAIALLGCGVAYGWTRQQPRIYQADCALEYDPSPPKPLGAAVEEVAAPMVWWESREYFATQNRIIASRAVAERVARKLSLHQNADFFGVPSAERKRWRGRTVTDAARALQSMTTVTQERDTRLVHVQVRDRSPERAQLLANSLAAAYIEKTMEDRLGATSSALDWLGKQLDTLKSQLERSELALHDFSEQHSNLAVSLEDQQNIVAGNIDQLSRALIGTKTKRIEVEARLAELKAALRDDPSDVHTSGVLASPTVGGLRERYRTLVTEREALAVQYGEAHPKIVSLNAQLATVQEAMRRAIGALVAAAQSDLSEIQQIERGEQQALAAANKVGIDLNLQEITFRRLQRERDNTAKLYGTLLERTAQTDLTRALQVSYVRVVDPALVPAASVAPRVRLSLAVGLLLGLLLGIGLAITLDQLDRVIRTVEDAEALGLTVLGVVPRIEEGTQESTPAYARRRRAKAPELVTNRDLVVHAHPKSSVAECCRTIRTNLSFMGAEHPLRALVVTSARPREGKTTVALSLAISFAQSGRRVLVVDTDLRKPRTHKALGRANARGVTTILVGEHGVKDAIQTTDIPGLDVLTSGPIPPNPAELLHTDQFRDLLQELRRRYDHVIFDSPPLAAVTDAAIVGPQMDGVLLVVHGQKTTREALRSALRQLRDVKAHVTGGVLNDVDLSSRHYGYGSYYSYHGEGYYESHDEAPKRTDAPAAEE